MSQYTSEEAQEIANIIAQQMGGTGRINAMIGVKHFVAGADGHPSHPELPYLKVTFKAKAMNKAKQFVVFYDYVRDLYNVEFWKNIPNTLKGLEKAQKDLFSFRISQFEGMYADQLKELFEKETGLYLSL